MTFTEALIQAGFCGIIRRHDWTNPGNYGEPVWVIHNAQIKEYKFDRLGTPIMYTFDVTANDWEVLEKSSTENTLDTLEKIKEGLEGGNLPSAMGMLQHLKRTLEKEYKYKKIMSSLGK